MAESKDPKELQGVNSAVHKTQSRYIRSGHGRDAVLLYTGLFNDGAGSGAC